MRPHLIFILLFNIAFSNLALALDGVVSENCSPPKPVLKPPSSSVKTSGKEVTVIQTVDSCPKTQSGTSSQGIELIEKSAKFAIDAAGESTKASASSVKSTLELVQDLLKAAAWILTFVLGLMTALATFFGWKTIKELKVQVHNMTEKEAKEKLSTYDKQLKTQLTAYDAQLKTQLTATATQLESVKTVFSSIEGKSKASEIARNFSVSFTIAKMESLLGTNILATVRSAYSAQTQSGFVSPPSGVKLLLNSALRGYRKLIGEVEKLSPEDVKSFIASADLREEQWDSDTQDDYIFLKCWILQDAAFIEKRLGQLDSAINNAKRGIEINPNAWSLIYNLACYQCLNKDIASAKITFERCLQSPYADTFREWQKTDDDLKGLN